MRPKRTAKGIRNTVKTLPCQTARQTSHGLIRAGKECLPCANTTPSTAQICQRGSTLTPGQTSLPCALSVDARQTTSLCRVLFVTAHGKHPVFAVFSAQQARHTRDLCRAHVSSEHDKETIWSPDNCQVHRCSPHVGFAMRERTAQVFAVFLVTEK